MSASKNKKKTLVASKDSTLGKRLHERAREEEDALKDCKRTKIVNQKIGPTSFSTFSKPGTTLKQSISRHNSVAVVMNPGQQ